MKKQPTILTFLLLFLPGLLLAQLLENLNYRFITTRDGLPSTKISCIHLDKNGFVWIGTIGAGLYQYDGYTFKEFRYDYKYTEDTTAYIEDMIYCIIEDESGILWIGSSNGLYKCNPLECNQISDLYQMDKFDWHKNEIYSIHDDNKGNLWLGLRNANKIAIFNKKNENFSYIQLIKDFQDQESAINEWICPVVQDKEGNIWVGTSQALCTIDTVNKQIENFKPDPAGQNSFSGIINSLVYEEKNDLIWIGTDKGLYTYNRNKNIFKRLYKNWVFNLTKDNTGYIWCYKKEGISRFIPDSSQINIELFYPKNWDEEWYTGHIIDKSDNMWITIWREGIRIVCPERKDFKVITVDSIRLGGSPSSVCEDNEGNIWIGTWGSGLTKYTKETNELKHYLNDPADSSSLSGNEVSYVYCDRTGTLWAGIDGFGLNKMIITKDKKTEFKKYVHDTTNPGSIISNKIFRIIEDKENNLWILAYNNIDRYDKERDCFDHLDTETDCINSGDCELEEQKNEMWFPTWREIYRFLPPYSRTSEYSIKPLNTIRYKFNPDDPISMPSFPLTNTFCLSRIFQPGTLWFGDHSGLGMMMRNDNKNNIHRSVIFKYYSYKEGFTGNKLCGILEDKNGSLWISSDKGLFRFDPRSETFTYYSVTDFLKSNQFEGWKPCMDREGYMYFPHSDGLLIFNPDSLQGSINESRVIITDLKIYGKSVVIGNASPLKIPVSYTTAIELQYKQNYLSFDFALLDFTDPKKNQFRYRLEGLDKDWIVSGSNHTASYSNLVHGKYKFYVQGANSMGIWNNEGASLEIQINPPWWKTMVAYMAYIMFVFLFLAGYIKLRTRRLTLEKVKLEKQVAQRTKEIEHQKEKIEESNEELLQQKEELLSTLDNLRKTQEQLIESEKMASLGGLVAGVAHEINTPVGITITAASGLLEETHKMVGLYKEDKINRTEFKEYLNNANHAVKLIMSNMEKAATMVQSFKQISVDQSLESKRTFNLKDYTEDIIRSLYPKLKNRKIDIILDIDNNLEIDSYPGAYSQVITNLLLNSLIHGFEEKQEGQIDIRAFNKNGELIIEYKDNGKGIANENLKKIFDPFFTTNKKSGTGLGLHIVYNLVTQRLDGKINVQSHIEKGTVFFLNITGK